MSCLPLGINRNQPRYRSDIIQDELIESTPGSRDLHATSRS
jgi:hypothetical protein